MTFQDSFCPSPWFHMRINPAGHYEFCRWADKSNRDSGPNIKDVDPDDFFQNYMQPVRQQLLNGEVLQGCKECHLMEQHGKISGRQRQLLKIGVRVDQFEKTLVSSPWIPIFTNNKFDQMPQDWQIDLGNYCNSACIFCEPAYSSRLATEWKRIGFIDQLPKAAWADNPVLVEKFLQTLKKTPTIKYLHFIGGETVITPAFKIILQALIDQGLNKTATIGFTTNLISWDDEVVELLTQFQGINLGMSVETFTPVNDYIRWPSDLSTVLTTLDRWQTIATMHGWFMQFRTTPTVLSISNLLSVYDYALSHGIAVESCNFLQNPAFMRPSVLPQSYRNNIIAQIRGWANKNRVEAKKIINTRHPDNASQQIVQDIESYVNYLEQEPDQSHRLPDLIAFLKKLEVSRQNCIIDYLPEYENLFRSAGY